ncbi:acyl-CoA thioester hydrolase [Amphiplicatus metriothermophilus]|uniref:Acyl-CoA thioester hydrolase n=2 Tax=Amphiplicatus metriothermophilus TaxID=1519374 RepID=A0A239PRI0_9PROT|nr:acyl-CoA thioester hydrolase [Amphiplicatus metriothermophilus]
MQARIAKAQRPVMVRAMSHAARPAWPVAEPFVVRRLATAGDADAFGHVNNVRYIDWAMEAAWAHSQALGLSFADYERLGVGCVVQRHEFDYLAPVMPGETVAVATWIAECDGRVRLTRAFEMRRESDGAALFRGRTKFVTIDMKTGRPARMPPEFVAAYRPAG